MILDTKKMSKILIEKKISPTQYFIISCLHNRDFKSLSSYIEFAGKSFSHEIDDLINRGLVIDLNVSKERYADSMMVSDKFLKDFAISSKNCGEELWNTYPWYFYSDDKQFPAKSADKDDLIEMYYRRINHSVSEHKRVMAILSVLIKNDTITMGIQKWVASEQWNASNDLMPTEQETGTDDIFDLEDE